MASSSSFRASNFINYGPDTQRSSTSSGTTTLVPMKPEEDIDEPQISAFRDEASPPPPVEHSSTNTRGLKLVLKRRPGSTKADVSRHEANDSNKRKRESVSISDEEDDHENQSINSDEGPQVDELWADEDNNVTTEGDNKRKSGNSTPSASHGKGRAAARGGRGRGRGRGRGGVVSAAEPPQTVFEITPSVAQAEHGTPGIIEPESVSAKAPRKRKVERAKKGERKPKGTKALQQIQDDNASIASESHVGTAASSPYFPPVARESNFDGETPDIEPLALPQASEASQVLPEAQATAAPPPLVATENVPPFTLDQNIPIPIYRLPTKPFLVQPPPKAPTGFAPYIPLDKNRMPVRRWRPALRAIRGIAGGQWFAKTWVGDKESEYSSVGHEEPPIMGVMQANPSVGPVMMFGSGRGRGSGRASPSPMVPKLLGMNNSTASSISAPAGGGTTGGGGGGGGKGGRRTKRTNASATATAAASTAASSRSGSVDFMPPEYPPAQQSQQQQHQQQPQQPTTPSQHHVEQYPVQGGSNVRTPSKMRIAVSAQDYSDVEMEEPVEEIEAQ